MRNQADGPRVGIAVGKRQIESGRWTENAQAVRAEQTNTVTARVLDNGALNVGASRPCFRESTGKDNGRACAGSAASLDDSRRCLGTSADDSQVKTMRNRFHRFVTRLSEDGGMLGIDEKDFAFEGAVENVADKGFAYGSWSFRGTNDGDRFGIEERCQIVALVVHLGVSSLWPGCLLRCNKA